MNFEQAKIFLYDNYIKAGFSLGDDHSTELYFYPPKNSNNLIRISEQEIQEYADFKSNSSIFEKKPVECGICSSNYREQLIGYSYQDRGRFSSSRDTLFVFGNKGKKEIYAEIGRASMTFINYFRFEPVYLQLNIERMESRFILRERGLDMQDFLYRPMTIRVYNLQKSSASEALEISLPIVEACLFELPYMKNITFTLEEEWPRRQPTVKPFRFDEQNTENLLPLKHVHYNSTIIRFYQRGMSSLDPVNQFLSFYHILEYFFVTISDKELYDKLARRINDPKLSAAQKYLDGIIQDVVQHKRQTDETEMLKLVLNKFVDEADLIEFIKAYEKHLNENPYTKKRTIFDTDIEIKLTPGHVTGNIAKLIKTIRNALVHSSDRHEGKERYIPSVKAEEIIKREIPLLKYIAEKVIIASATSTSL